MAGKSAASTQKHTAQIDAFSTTLKQYCADMEADIASYCERMAESVRASYGAKAAYAVDAYLDILGRGGKRIRGALTMHGYYMCGGTDAAMIVQAARAIEMIHAALLIMDDIQDRSLVRRGGPAAHILLQKPAHAAGQEGGAVEKGAAGHIGVALALNAMLVGLQQAQGIIANLPADDQQKLMALSIISRTVTITAHGQSYDILNQLATDVAEAEIDKVMEWKTALYTMINPLHVGMVLAGAGCEYTDAITPYATHLGKAFQITDDLLGMFGTQVESGKNPQDDMAEGKCTLLVAHTLQHAPAGDAEFVRAMLGNDTITNNEFTKVQQIMEQCGAREYALRKAEQHIRQALKSLKAAQGLWPQKYNTFLEGMAWYVLTRTK